MILDNEIRRSSSADALTSACPARMGVLMYGWIILPLTARTYKAAPSQTKNYDLPEPRYLEVPREFQEIISPKQNSFEKWFWRSKEVSTEYLVYMHLILWEQDHVLILFKKKQLYVQSCTVYETIYHYQKLSKPDSLQRASWNVINFLSFLVQNRQVFPKDLQTKNAKNQLSVGLTPQKRRGPRKTCPRNTPWLRKGPTITWVQGGKKHALLRPNHKWHEGAYTLIPKVHPSSAQKTTCESGIVNQVIKFHLIWWLFDHFIKSGWVVCRNLKEVLANSMWFPWNLQAIWVVACYTPINTWGWNLPLKRQTQLKYDKIN